MNVDLVNGWVEFLGGQHYDCFMTMTFDPAARSGAAASSSIALWRSREFLIRFFSGRRERAIAFLAAEPFDLGNYHVHGLLDTHGSAELRYHLWRAAKRRHGRARFEPFEDAASVQAYVIKYVMKAGCDYCLLSPARQFEVSDQLVEGTRMFRTSNSADQCEATDDIVTQPGCQSRTDT